MYQLSSCSLLPVSDTVDLGCICQSAGGPGKKLYYPATLPFTFPLNVPRYNSHQPHWSPQPAFGSQSPMLTVPDLSYMLSLDRLQLKAAVNTLGNIQYKYKCSVIRQVCRKKKRAAHWENWYSQSWKVKKRKKKKSGLTQNKPLEGTEGETHGGQRLDVA